MVHKAETYLKREFVLRVIEIVEKDKDCEGDIAALLKAANKIKDVQSFTKADCDDAYEAIIDNEDFDPYLTDVRSYIRDAETVDAVVTGIPIKRNEDRPYLETESVAISITGSPNLYLGYIRYYGGGKHSEPEAEDWESTVYLVERTKRIQTVFSFSRFE